ncbi:MAG: alpha-N-acetylglucosaminidase C-terminal domain-containing protein, partial [Chitinophagales bacterium]
QWSGLLNDFYRQRWLKFFVILKNSFRGHTNPNFEEFEKKIRVWEWHWVNEQSAFSLTPKGNSISKAQDIYKKYRESIGNSY